MNWKLIFIVITAVFFCRMNLVQAETSAYEALTDSQKKIVDIILDEFKRNHMIFLVELSDMRILKACSGIGEGASHSHKHDGHDEGQKHSDGDDNKDEHLAVRAIMATPDANGNFLTPTFTGPNKSGSLTTYTYKELHVVSIADKKITVTMTRAEEGNPLRQDGKPDPNFIKSLAARLDGKATDDSVILP